LIEHHDKYKFFFTVIHTYHSLYSQTQNKNVYHVKNHKSQIAYKH